MHGIAIKCTFTTCLHTPFTEVPERGAIWQPFARGRNNHTATLGVTISVVKSRQSAGPSKQLGDKKKKKKSLKGYFTQRVQDLAVIGGWEALFAFKYKYALNIK